MIKRKLETVALRLSTEEKKWLIKEAKKWEVSQSQIIRSLIRAKISVDNKEL